MFQHPALQGVQSSLKQFQTAPAGRPVKNNRPLMLRSSDRLASGFELLNDTPAVVQSAMDKYIKKAQLPPGLAPTKTHVRSQIGEDYRARQISKGFQRPTSRY